MDSVWEHILNNIEYQNTNQELTADKIKQCKQTYKGPANQFEPRLLAYQPSSEKRPKCFKTKGIYLLPIRNGTYILTQQSVYYTLSYPPTLPIKLCRDSSSVLLSVGDSETSLIHNLRYSGAFERQELLGEQITHGPLLTGRHRCTFNCTLGETPLNISGVQYEIDACFESKNNILIIEGKSSPIKIESFNIRQLYFPYRELYKTASQKGKSIQCVFLYELRGIIHLWKFSFTDLNKMDSIKCDGYYTYIFSS